MIRKLIRLRFWALLYSLNNTGRKKSQKASTSKGKLILMAALYLYLGIVFVFLFSSAFSGLGILFLPNGMEWMYFAMFAILSFCIIFIGTVFTSKSVLFEAKDNEFLLSMPIHPRDILWSRLLYLLLMNYLMELTVAVPAFVCWILLGSVTFPSMIAFLTVTVLLPLFVTSISGGFAWLLALITSKLQKKNLLTVVASLIFVFVYFYIVNNLDDYLILFQENSDRITGAMAKVLPVFWIGSAIGNGNFLHLLYAVIFLGVPFALMVWILSVSYLRILTTKSSGHQKKSKAPVQVRASTSFSALLRREFYRLFGSTTYLLNSAVAIPLEIVATVAILLNFRNLQPVFEGLGWGYHEITVLILLAIMCFSNSMALITAPSVSLEGKGIALLHALPVSATSFLRAKLVLHLIMMVPTNLICALVYTVVFLPPLEGILLLVTVPNLFAVWVANIGLICNLCHPLMDWNQEAQPVKQSVSILLTMLFGTLMLLGMGICAFLLSFISMWLSLAVSCAVLGIGDWLTYRYLMRGGATRWTELG